MGGWGAGLEARRPPFSMYCCFILLILKKFCNHGKKSLYDLMSQGMTFSVFLVVKLSLNCLSLRDDLFSNFSN